MTRTLLLLLAAGLFLFASGNPPESPKITATDTGKSGPGAQTITGGDVIMNFAADGKPLSFTRGNGTNLINTTDPGPGFYLTAGSGPDETPIPFTSLESKDGKLILTADDKTCVTLAVNAGEKHIAFRLEKIENVPEGSEPVLNFRVNFKGACPEFVPFDYMCTTSGRFATVRSFGTAAWPYFWRRAVSDPLGGFAFFVPRDDDDHNDSLLRIWTEEKVPHPKVEGEWTYEVARKWAEDWEKRFENSHALIISAAKPEDLDILVDYAKKLKVNRVYMHTDTWRGAYWVYDRDPLSVNQAVFPNGEQDLKAFIDKLKANNMDVMMHTLCYGFGPEGSKYIGRGKKTDLRIANWGKGNLEKSISATDTTILFRPDPGVVFPVNSNNAPMGAPETNKNSYAPWFKFDDVRIDDEIIQCQFEDTDQPVWKLTKCVRGPSATTHEAGSEIVGLLKAYAQNYYPDSMTDLSEITARDYAEFFNRLGVHHHEYDGAECHNDVPWGFPKWSMFVYQNTDHPMTSNTSGGGPNPWDLMYRFKKNGVENVYKKGSNHGSGSGSAALALHRDGRLATSPIENHFTLALGAVANSPGFVFGKPEPMFGIFPNVIQDHGLATLIADQFAIWREIAPKLTPEMRKQISDAYYLDKTPNTMNRPSGHRSAKIVYEARRAGEGYEIQPFTIMTRGEEDADWTTVQEFSGILPRQYVAPGMRVRLDNPFDRQAPQFIIRVMNGYTDAVATVHSEAPAEELSKDLQGYLIGAGVQVDNSAPVPAATPSATSSDPYRLQPKAEQITNPGKHLFADVGPALEMSFDNLVEEEPPAETSADPTAEPTPTPSPTPKREPAEHFQQDGFPRFACKGDARNARGLALTVTGDGSGAFLVIQVGPSKDYVVPIDFTGRKDIFIPIGEVARTTGRWGMRYHTKRSGYGVFHGVSIGFGRVPANTFAKVLIENLRMVGEEPSSIKNPVIHAGTGSLSIQGEVKSDQYLWYQGGDTVGVYDLNWCLVANLPVEPKDYEVDKGFSDFWIDGECANPPPWFDVQFITKGETVKLENAPVNAAN